MHYVTKNAVHIYSLHTHTHTHTHTYTHEDTHTHTYAAVTALVASSPAAFHHPSYYALAVAGMGGMNYMNWQVG